MLAIWDNEQLVIGVERNSSLRYWNTMVNGQYVGYGDSSDLPAIEVSDAYITLCRSACQQDPDPNPYPTRITPSDQAHVCIDLDRSQAGIQDTLYTPEYSGGFPISGQVLVQTPLGKWWAPTLLELVSEIHATPKMGYSYQMIKMRGGRSHCVVWRRNSRQQDLFNTGLLYGQIPFPTPLQ